MNQVIFINTIIEPIHFGNRLLEFLFSKYKEIEITVYGKIDSVDKKSLDKINKTSFLGKVIFQHYKFSLDIHGFNNIKNKIEKYFNQDWGLFINENHKGLFSYKMNVFNIDCIDANDKKEKIQFFQSLVENNIIDQFEIIEDDYIDPYYNKE